MQRSRVLRVNSHAVVPTAETIMVQATVHNMTAGSTSLKLQLEGSYDGQVWLTTGLSTADITFTGSAPLSQQSTTKVAQAYAFIRLRATVSIPTEGGIALFSANVVFSHQEN